MPQSIYLWHLTNERTKTITGQSVPVPRHSQTRAKNADLVTLETFKFKKAYALYWDWNKFAIIEIQISARMVQSVESVWTDLH